MFTSALSSLLLVLMVFFSNFSFHSNFSLRFCRHSNTLCQEHPLHANFTIMIFSLLSGVLHLDVEAGALAFLQNSGIVMPADLYYGVLLPWDFTGILCLGYRVLVSTFCPPCSHRDKHTPLQKARQTLVFLWVFISLH